MQNSANSYGMNQQGSCGQNHYGQPMQQDPFVYNSQQQNPCSSNLQSVSGNPCLCTPGISQSQMIPCNNYLPQNILEQIRTCVGNTSPIFIIPNSQPIQSQLPQIQQNPLSQMPINMGYPSSIGIGYPSMGSNPIFSPPCYPFQVQPPFYNPFSNQNRSQSERNSMVCDCCRINSAGNQSSVIRNSGISSSNCEENETHRCSPGNDDTVCTKANCPASINLQALASQLLSLQGVIPCAATRLVMRKVPGSNVTTTIEQTMERAQKTIGSLNKEQLINEARNAHQVNSLINLHMIANPPQNIIPVLTMLQLKVNSLKALVENLVNKSISECQNIGAQGNTSLEPMVLAIKNDGEIRELLATLRQKECEERVNVNYAPYHSQRVIAESRLANFQNKISQVEAEMERRRASGMPWVNSPGTFNQTSFPGGGYCRSNFLHETHGIGGQGFNPMFNTHQVIDSGGKGFDSPSPFMVQVQSPRRLNLKPNVGGPQTTYHQSSDEHTMASPEAFAVSKLDKETKGYCESGKSCCHEDQENGNPSREASDSGKVGTEGKKKLKIHIDDKGELSVKKQSLEELDVGDLVHLSSDVVIVIDKDMPKSIKDKDMRHNKLKKKNKKISIRKKSAESVPSDSTYDSETSVSSRSSGAEGKRRELGGDKSEDKSVPKKILKGKKKTTKIDNNITENVSHDIPEVDDVVEPRTIKNEKYINVATLSELFYDRFISYNETDSIRSGTENRFESSEKMIEKNVDGELEKLDISIEENGYSHKVEDNPETIRTKEFRSALNEDKNKDEEMKRSLIKPGQSLLKEAQNQTGDDNYIRPFIVGTKNTLKGNSYKDNKENILENSKTCSIIGKRNRDNQSLQEGSVTSYMCKDQRKKHNYRFR